MGFFEYEINFHVWLVTAFSQGTCERSATSARRDCRYETIGGMICKANFTGRLIKTEIMV
jgi:hypothetical protein